MTRLVGPYQPTEPATPDPDTLAEDQLNVIRAWAHSTAPTGAGTYGAGAETGYREAQQHVRQILGSRNT